MECKDIPGKEKCLILLLVKFLKVSQLQINAKDQCIKVLVVKGKMWRKKTGVEAQSSLNKILKLSKEGKQLIIVSQTKYLKHR